MAVQQTASGGVRPGTKAIETFGTLSVALVGSKGEGGYVISLPGNTSLRTSVAWPDQLTAIVGTVDPALVKAAERRKWRIYRMGMSSFAAAEDVLGLLSWLRTEKMASKTPANNTATSKIENLFFQALYAKGVPEAVRSPSLRRGSDGAEIGGKPDGWWDPTPTQMIALYVDGLYWHHDKPGADLENAESETARAKARAVLERDRENTAVLESGGITVIRVDDGKHAYGLGTKEGFERSVNKVATKILGILKPEVRAAAPVAPPETPRTEPADVALPEELPEPFPPDAETTPEMPAPAERPLVIEQPPMQFDEPAETDTGFDLDDIFGSEP